jgi:phage repressor protein C with HTH and peptisase S24 domain
LFGVAAVTIAAGYSLDWLLTGKGPKHLAPTNRLPVQPGNHLVDINDIGPEAGGYTLIPRYAVNASAGNGLVALGEEVAERLAFNTNWLRSLGLSLAHVGLVTCVGDSQSPTIPNGALMLVDMSPDQQIRSGQFYVIVLDGDLLVKRLFRKVDGTIELISDNPIYQTETIQASYLERLNIPGRVAWVFHEV